MRGEERDSSSRGTSPASAPAAMHVFFEVVGRVVVDDHGELANVKAARCDACGHEDAAHAGFEVTDHAFAVGLQRHEAERLVLQEAPVSGGKGACADQEYWG